MLWCRCRIELAGAHVRADARRHMDARHRFGTGGGFRFGILTCSARQVRSRMERRFPDPAAASDSGPCRACPGAGLGRLARRSGHPLLAWTFRQRRRHLPLHQQAPQTCRGLSRCPLFDRDHSGSRLSPHIVEPSRGRSRGPACGAA